MKTLSIDIETYSEADLNRTGVYRYAEDPSFEILLFGYSADGVFHQGHIDQDAPVIDLLVDAVLIPHFFRHGVVGQPALDLHFRFHVAPVVNDELLPAVGGVLRKVSGALPVGLGRSAGTAEVADQVAARFQLLLLQPQHRAGAGERKRKTEVG